MNDYKRIHRRSESRNSRRIKPEDTLSMHRKTKQYLEEVAAARDPEMPFVVVTHHPPSMVTVDKGAHGWLGFCYGSDLDDWAGGLGADLWIHGHTHKSMDYRFGGTPAVTNARGHWMEETGFRPGLVVDVPLRPIQGVQ